MDINITILTCEYSIAQISCLCKVNSPEFTSGNRISCRNYHLRYPPVGGSTRQTSHSPNQLAVIHDLAGKYTPVGIIQKPSGEEGGTYIIFTGNYGDIKFKM